MATFGRRFLTAWFGNLRSVEAPEGLSGEEDLSLLTDLAEDGDVAVVALRIVLQHWISWSKPAVVPSATLRSVAWLLTPSKPCRSGTTLPKNAKAETFAATFPGLRAMLEDTFSHEVRLNQQLHSAAQRTEEEFIQQAIALGADVNSKNKDGWTALHIAASKGSAEICRMLLDVGADPGILCRVPVWPKEDFTPLRIALRFVKARLKELDYHRKRLADGRRGLWSLRGVVHPQVEAEVLRVLVAKPCEEDVLCGVVASAASLLKQVDES
ncbi:unnamed protein product [Cladocopium goreaui]|uniref:Protein phosphatase 1 regulatory subunit 27 n=1 Tax=Cladocopium goreaui TaxID=2562237 RepID=A0A9P1GM98_9DINO|nr:unnamed protein product [Cladocopium goreaui]